MPARTALPLALLLAATPLAAQETPPPAESEDGFSLIEEGAKLLLRGLMSEVEPTLDDMGRAMEEMGPAFEQLIAMIEDIRNYDAPVRLPNGDILIPRKPGAPPYVPLEEAPRTDPLPTPGPGGEVEL